MNIKYQEKAIKSHLSFALIPSHFISTYLCNFSKHYNISNEMRSTFFTQTFILLLLLFLSLLFYIFLHSLEFVSPYKNVSVHSILFVWRTLYFFFLYSSVLPRAFTSSSSSCFIIFFF